MTQNRLWSLGFLLIAVLLGPFLVFHVPPGHNPDERNHILRADSLLHGQFIGHRELINGKLVEGLIADQALAQVITLPPAPLDTAPQAITPVQKWLSTEVPWNSRPVFIQAGSIAGYMPLLYLPGAAAIALCRMANLPPHIAFLAVRIMNFYGFLILGALALRITRRGTTLIFATLLLPMTLSLAASCSQDGLLIAGTACAIACLTRAAEPKYHLTAAILIAIVAASKPPYAPLALLLLQKPIAQRIGLASLAILPALIWTFLESRIAGVPIPRPSAEAGPLWPGPRPAAFAGPDPLAQLHVLWAHKTLFVTLPLISCFNGAASLLQQAIGVLDYLCLYLPDWLYLVWQIGLACALAAHLCSTGTLARQTIFDFLLASTAILLSTIAIGLALYLDWTPVGMPWIGGIQGRYFLPLLPVLTLALPRFTLPKLSSACATVTIATALLSAIVLPGIITAFYPLR